MPRKPALPCDNYSAGHAPHFIQARLCWKETWSVVKVSFTGSASFRLEFEDGRTILRYNHDPARLIEHLDQFVGWPVSYCERFHLLGIPTGKSQTAMFSLSKSPLERCLGEPTAN